MKKRVGFVSNSSSASYIIKLSCSKDELIEEIGKYFFTEYLLPDIIKKAKEQLESTLKYKEQMLEMKKNSNYKGNLLLDPDSLESLAESQHQELMNIISAEKAEDHEEIGKAIVDFLKWEITQDRDVCILENSTTMHNSYNTGMGHNFREFVLYLNFGTDLVLHCEIEQ